MSETCVSPLSNTVVGIGDAGMAAMLINRSGMLNLSQLRFMVGDIAVTGTGINDPGYSLGDGCHHFLVGSLSAHALQQMVTDSQCIGDDCERGVHCTT